MSQYTNEIKTFTAGEDLVINRIVRLEAASGSSVVYADEYDDDVILGVTVENVSSGDHVAVELFAPNKTMKLTASAALSAANSALYLTDDGKVKNSGQGNEIARNRETATADGAIVECQIIFAHTSAGSIGS